MLATLSALPVMQLHGIQGRDHDKPRGKVPSRGRCAQKPEGTAPGKTAWRSPRSQEKRGKGTEGRQSEQCCRLVSAGFSDDWRKRKGSARGCNATESGSPWTPSRRLAPGRLAPPSRSNPPWALLQGQREHGPLLAST